MSKMIPVLDPEQLKRIEAVHRGFFYQHLYAAACLLLASEIGAIKIIVEADEDIEIVFPNKHIYIQIKTRSGLLGQADIAGALTRFESLREEHATGRRAGDAKFLVVSNISPGKKLLDKTKSENWFSDTSLVFPGCPSSDVALPEAWPSVPDAISSCSKIAASMPFGTLMPETLVLKVSAMVMAAAAGIPPSTDHTFQTADNATLFEQLAIQLQDFPAPPPRYRPQADEPILVSDAKIRLISGFSGAGKTAWVAQASLHSNSDLVYFDVGDTPGSALSIPLARELAGRFFGKGGGLGEILLPGATGTEMLGAIGRRLSVEGIDTTVVIDNAHRADADHLISVIRGTAGVRFLLLCQPGPVVGALKASLGVAVETLPGWSPDTIAAEAADSQCIVTPESAQKLFELTAGLPLFVQSAVRIAAQEYSGDLSAFCSDINQQLHSATTAQELILAKTFERIGSEARDALSVLSISDLPLQRKEVAKLLGAALSLDEKGLSRLVRELRPIGAIEVFGDSRIKIHDALRVLGRAHLDSLGAETCRSANAALRDVLLVSIVQRNDLAKLSLLLRVFEALGEIKPLVEFATDEIFHEFGLVEQIYGTLEVASQSDKVAPEERFAALDGLVFSDLKVGNLAKARVHLERMAEIAVISSLDETDQLSLAMKQMLFDAANKDAKGVGEKLLRASSLVPGNPVHRRIFRYNTALALFHLNRYEDCIAETEKLVPEYYDVLGLSVPEVIGKNPDEIWPLVDRSIDQTDNLKHLGDCLDLQAQALNRTGRGSPFGRIHAAKFYAMANAIDSAVRVGQDLADEFIERCDYIGARDIVERNVIPNVVDLKMTSFVVPARSQYAVILAYCGDFAAADREMTSLAPYERGLSVEGQKELRWQRELIEQLRKRPPPPQWQMPSFSQPFIPPPRKMGRNEPCYCGSGVKFKRCHGKIA